MSFLGDGSPSDESYSYESYDAMNQENVIGNYSMFGYDNDFGDF